MTPDGWHKIDRGLFESADGQWRIANPVEAHNRATPPLARGRAPGEWIGLVHARRSR